MSNRLDQVGFLREHACQHIYMDQNQHYHYSMNSDEMYGHCIIFFTRFQSIFDEIRKTQGRSLYFLKISAQEVIARGQNLRS